ncbi:Uu.00g065070.m01.CDS01 [Anthostomella pinea]|uniref:Uu.00g065070.m01.CDS01 n=1 Tax=Anthostomella pinea TaxID=933095 RepID=A0AAI8VTM9_9PEZI|nr:Uu.00g065070.m01.CDS01 [Anthostomella pinea]
MATDHAQTARWQDDLLPHIIDRLARERPDGIYGLWPVAPDSYAAGFRTVTYAQLANAVNGLAWWLVQHLGPSQQSRVLAYVGPNDVRLVALGLAAIKAGYTVGAVVPRHGSLTLFLTSPRNSPAAHRALFESLECRTLVTTDPTPPSALPILEAVNPTQLTAPSVDDVLGISYPPYVYEKTFQEARWDPLFIIHTSGSTGLPKPLIWTQETGARQHNLSAREPPDGGPSIDSFCHGERVLVTLPPFHGAGLAQYLMNAVPFGNIAIAPAAVGIATAEGLVDALKQTPASIAVLVPSVVAELAQNPDLLDYCAAHLKMILYIGGDLPQAIGDRVAAKVRLRCQWGASEVGIPQQLMPPELGPMDWRYIRFHPSVGAFFDEVTDGAYELVIRRDEARTDTQPAFSVRGQDQLKEYRTRDLFERHPTVPDAWCWRARADDIIVFLNGEKTNPVSMEQHVVASNPELSGAIVIGAQRFQAALLIEPTSEKGIQDTAEPAALVERVWKSVQEANQAAPAHARVEKALILVTYPDRPLIRAGKGTIQRSASLAQYTAEIDRLYANADLALEDDVAASLVDPTDVEETAVFIRDTVQSITGWQGLDESVDFFAHGMDSLQALQLTRVLRRGLRRNDLALSTVYKNSTVAQLNAAILARHEGADDADILASLLSTYRGLIHQMEKPPQLDRAKAGVVDVVLTGSTGTLGTYMLRSLLGRAGIGHVYCLNRAEDGGRSAQAGRFAAANLPSDGLADRVTFLHADLAHPTLGLDKTTYETLRAQVGIVIHNAWPVNFNLGLSAFRPQLVGLVNLFALSAAAAPRAMRIVFISSVGAVGGRPAAAGPAPDAVLESLDTPSPNGYARSKFLSELFCDTAARHLGIAVAIARVGQVAGPVRQSGMWNRAEWLPSLVVSSIHLGCLPDSLGPQFSEVDWIPSDLLADVVVDLASLWGISPGAHVFNLRNPHTTAWNALLPTIQSTVQAGLGQLLEVVPSDVWLSRLQESIAATNRGGEDALAAAAVVNPAIKLLDFYRYGLWAREVASQQMTVEHALVSQTLRDMPPVSDAWMRQWVEEWIGARGLKSG